VTGPKSLGLVWELRDSAGTLVQRSTKPLVIGAVTAGGRVTIPVVVTMPSRPGEARLSLGLADSSGAPLAGAGVATSTLVLKVHDPYPVAAEVKLPSILHRREASLIEVRWSVTAAAAGREHDLDLGWRLIDTTTGRVVADGIDDIGTMKRDQSSGVFFAPFNAPAVRGAYTLEWELREGDSVAGPTSRKRVEILGPRTFGR